MRLLSSWGLGASSRLRPNGTAWLRRPAVQAHLLATPPTLTHGVGPVTRYSQAVA